MVSFQPVQDLGLTGVNLGSMVQPVHGLGVMGSGFGINRFRI